MKNASVHGPYKARELPPWLEQEPERPPDLLNAASVHCITYPTPFQNEAMQLKYEQKFEGGAKMNEPPQNVYAHGLVAAPQVLATGAAVFGEAVGADVVVTGRAVGNTDAVWAGAVGAAVVGITPRVLAAAVGAAGVVADRADAIRSLPVALVAELEQATAAVVSARSASTRIRRNTTIPRSSNASRLRPRDNIVHLSHCAA